MKTFAHIVGTRPNFIKAMPVYSEMTKAGWLNYIIHTGQHYDELMSDVFFKDLHLPKPDYFLDSTALPDMIEKIGDVLSNHLYDGVVIYGDVHSSLAGCIAAMNLDIPVIHVESGLRSRDKSMPEERNRIIIDHMAKYRFCTENIGIENLVSEGLTCGNYMVGNTAIDSLKLFNPVRNEFAKFVLVTLHRPFNVDDPKKLSMILRRLDNLIIPVVFPVHPRTKANLDIIKYSNIKFINPLGYKDFLQMMKNCHYMISDSGGVQCDAAAMNVPLFTLRPSTEHQKTLDLNMNKLISINDINIESINTWIEQKWNNTISPVIEWDGYAAHRLVNKLKELL
jgi:UDP-N-acetylglucosamine 2-epimerase